MNKLVLLYSVHTAEHAATGADRHIAQCVVFGELLRSLNGEPFGVRALVAKVPVKPTMATRTFAATNGSEAAFIKART